MNSFLESALLFDQSCDEIQRKYNDKGYVSEKNHKFV